ncbi:hypothetical protein H6P81_017980 [Aristolochia fimbriata]|uniref:Retrotransposon gag protein n=1 Tax=Aristolochia fimbriata TaxID=158543 RepID=A0AAV7E2V1_ARIFI|nr:hypothetical protein H6P81_017980 [Aristolochia fimbriata]
MTANMYQYPPERSSKKAAGVFKLDSTSVKAQLDALQQQIASLQQKPTHVVASICELCGGGHADYECQGFKPLPANEQQKELLATKAELEEEKKLNRAMYAELQSLRQSFTLLTTQVNHLNQGAYERSRGALPSNSEVNPKEQVKAITLRSGKTLEELQPKEQPAIEEEQNQKGEEEQRREKVSSPASPRKKKGKDALPITDIDVRNLPYPSRAKTDILESSFARFLEIFKNLQINIPLIEAVRQMPLYGKFLKEVISEKKKTEEQGTILQNENCSAILINKLPTKLKDPGSFTTPCEISSNKFANALWDLGASVNLMPLSLCRYLKLGEPQETRITLQFADRSTKIPEGVMEDVLVKIQDFIYPHDFVVLDMEVDKYLPIILEIEEEERIGEAKEGGLVNSEEKEDEDPIMTREVDELEAESKEELEEEIKEQGAQEAPKPELKPLPNNLKYVFLEENDKPVIISSCLTGLEEKMLIEQIGTKALHIPAKEEINGTFKALLWG